MPSFWGGKPVYTAKTSLNLFPSQSTELTKDMVYAMVSKIAEWRLLAQKLNKSVVAGLLQHCETRMLGALDDQKNTQSSVLSASPSSSEPSFRR